MTKASSSAMPMPMPMPMPANDTSSAQEPALNRSNSNGPVLTFAPSTKFSPQSHRRTPSQESDEAGSDPDDMLSGQIEQDESKIKRDIAGRAIEKEKEHMSGFLYKKAGGAGKAWNKRWCVLRSQALSIYKNNNEYKLKRIIRADEIETVCAVEKRNHPFAFMVGTTGRSFYFEASSRQELESWIDAVQRAVISLNDKGGILPLVQIARSTSSSSQSQSQLIKDAQTDTATPQRQFATTSRAAPLSPIAATDCTFLSLPSATGSSLQRTSGTLHPVQSIFASEGDVAADIGTNENLGTAAAERGASPSELRVDTSIVPRSIPTHPVADAIETAVALPPGVDVEHEPVPIAEEEGEAEEDDEPNFNIDQRREIENKLSEDHVVLSGYLLKQDKLKQWRKRWFVLRRNTLSYYHSNKEYELKQILRREDIYAVREPDPCTAKAKSLRRGYFKIVTVKRSYWLAHDDILEAARWFQTVTQWKGGALDRPLEAVGNRASRPFVSPAAQMTTQPLAAQAITSKARQSQQQQQQQQQQEQQERARGADNKRSRRKASDAKEA